MGAAVTGLVALACRAFATASISVVAVVVSEPGKNYTTLFLGGAAFALISVVTLLKVKSVRQSTA